jgi:hypothetical protein
VPAGVHVRLDSRADGRLRSCADGPATRAFPPPFPPPILPCSPPTAVRLLEEFVHLAAGDCLVQNGATSHVGKVGAGGLVAREGRRQSAATAAQVAAAVVTAEGAAVPTLAGALQRIYLYGSSPTLNLTIQPAPLSICHAQWPTLVAASCFCCLPCLQLIIQLAKSRGINTINIIRDRPDRWAGSQLARQQHCSQEGRCCLSVSC